MVLALPITVFGAVGKPSGGGSSIQWELSAGANDGVELRVIDPEGNLAFSKSFPAGKTPTLRLQDLAEVIDGQYTYELRVIPSVSADVAKQLENARATGDDAAARKIMRSAGLEQTMTQGGGFEIRSGSFVPVGNFEPQADASTRRGAGPVTNARPGEVTTNPQVIPDDLIVQGSLCVGIDCVSTESFGFDTIRMKENNTRIDFTDTSSSAGFPSEDWEIAANDSASGGRNALIFSDSNTQLMVIEAGTSANAVYVDDTGRVGFRTSTPVLDLHVNTSNTPALRLEQNNSGGFTAQTWDVAGNEANFFVRDVTSGSRLSFRIRPGAPTSSIDIAADGDVGIGTGSPAYKLNAVATGATDNTVFQIENNGPTRMRIKNTTSGETWNVGHESPSGTGLVFSDTGDGTTEMNLDVSGNMTIAGTLTQNSSRDVKFGFETIDPAAALAGVREMPILSWVYKHDEKAARHAGPMAEDFYAAFSLGVDDKHIAPSDQSSVALAAIQGLANVVQEKDQRIQELEAQLQQIAKSIEELKSQR
jgi:hypothetical protein